MRVRSASTNECVNRIPVLLAQLGKCIRKLRSIQSRQHTPFRRMKAVRRRRLPRRKPPRRMRQARKGPRMGHRDQPTQNRGLVPVAVRNCGLDFHAFEPSRAFRHFAASHETTPTTQADIRHCNTRSSLSIQPYLQSTIENESKLCFPDPFVAICLCPQRTHFYKKIVGVRCRLGSIERTLHGRK